MDTLNLDRGSIEYRVRGDGEPLLLVHGAMVCDAWEAMLGHADLLDRFRVITYRRRGFGGSSPAPEGRTFTDEGADALALLDHLDIARTHVAGHSYGGSLVLQLALDAPERLASLALLEPGLFSVPSAAGFGEALAPVGEAFGAGDHERALQLFLDGVGGPDAMSRLAPHLPEGADAMALADLPTLFSNDLPILSAWSLDEDAASRIDHPTLSVLGGVSADLFQESSAKVEEVLPNAERLDVPATSHLLQMENPVALANGLSDFLTRHPITA